MATYGFTKELYFTTSTVIDWMDVFTRPLYKHIVIDSLRHCQEKKGLEIYAWVLMTNHLHMIISISNDGGNQCGHQTEPSSFPSNNAVQVSAILRDFKKYTSKSIVNEIEQNQQESRRAWLLSRCSFRGANDNKIKNYKFWQEGNHIETIRSYDFYKEKLNYIHMNPVKQEIVVKPEDYLYSSARNYCGAKGCLDIMVIP